MPGYRQVASLQLLAELDKILRQRFRWRDHAALAVRDAIIAQSEIVSPVLNITVCRDPDDNRVLECAVTGRADVVITGDKDLLTLGSHQSIPILTIRQFLDSQLR